MNKLLNGELSAAAEKVAQRLLGSLLIREINGEQLVGKIVETEAYASEDQASHSYQGSTPRTAVMFGPPGFVYVYFTYGMHYCMNVVVGKVGDGAAVLIRAIEPIKGEELMQINRQRKSGVELTNGPAKLCQALAIDKKLNGHDLSTTPLKLELESVIPTKNVVKTTRIGITKDTQRMWRFYIRENKFVSQF